MPGPFTVMWEPPFLVLIASGSQLWMSHGIRFDGKLWLVPSWLEIQEDRMCIPARMIRFDDHRHQETEAGSSSRWRFVVSEPIGPHVLDGFLPAGFEIRQGSEVTVAYPAEALPDIDGGPDRKG